MNDSKELPEPASAVSGSLGLANLDLLKFIPTVCVYPEMDYYDKLVVKTIGPLAVVVLFWCWPLSKAIRRKPLGSSRGTAARLSLFWLELVLISVSTTIMQCFMCDKIGEKLYLRAQLTLPCIRTSRRRRMHIVLSSLMVLVYPIGFPLLMFGLMYPNRASIRILMKAAKAQDAEQAGVTSLKHLKRASMASIHLKLRWLVKKFKNFTPTCWWMGIFVLVTRVCQTSLMVLCEKQSVQAGFASVITLIAIIVQREAQPYRRSSE